VLVGLLVFAAHFFDWVFSHTAVPDALLLMLVGIVLGPVLGAVPSDFFGVSGAVILAAALVIMLFDAGTRLDLGTLRAAARGALTLTVGSMVLAASGAAGLLYWLTDLSGAVAVIAGVLVSGVTSGVVLALLSQLQVSERVQTILTLEATMTDVLVLAVVLALLEAYVAGNFAVSALAWSVVTAMLAAAAIGFLVGVVWTNLLDTIRHLQNSLFVTAAAAFVLYGVLELMGLSGFIAVLTFGVTVGSVGAFNHYLAGRHRWLQFVLRPRALSRRERAFFGELVFLLQTFFFVYIGLSMQFASLYIVSLALAAAIVLLLLRFVAVRMGLPRDISVREASLAAVLIPKGFSPAVLVILLVQRDIPGALLVQEFTTALIFWSISVTSLFIFLIQRTAVGGLYGRLLRGFGTEPLLSEVPVAEG